MITIFALEPSIIFTNLSNLKQILKIDQVTGTNAYSSVNLTLVFTTGGLLYTTTDIGRVSEEMRYGNKKIHNLTVTIYNYQSGIHFKTS